MPSSAHLCAECAATAVHEASPMRCGDVVELVQSESIYVWSAEEGRALGSYPAGMRVIAIDQLPPRWWKVAVQASRWRVVIDDDANEPTLLYPNLTTTELKRVGALCPRHLNDLVSYFRPRADAWGAR